MSTPPLPQSTALPSTRFRLPAALRSLHHRNYRLFFGGQIISLVGTWMQSVAESWLMYRLTGSSALLGLTGFCAQIPVFVLATVGGLVADRYDRRRIIVTTQTCAMLLAGTLAVLTLTGRVQVWHLFTIATLLGTVNAFDIPARQAFVVDMVGREDLINAIALNSSMFNGARIVGPAVAGVLVAAIGEGWCFLANSISYIAVIAGLLMMHVERKASVAPRGAASVLEGFRYVRRTRPIMLILLMLGVVSLIGMPYAVLMPVFADRILHGGPRGLGMLMGASGIGALCGGIVLASRTGLKGLGKWVALAAAGFGTSLVLFSLSRSFWLSAALLVPTGFCMMVQMASSNTLVQSMVPDALRGRVMAIYSMMFMGMAPFGALFAGVVAERLGAPVTVAMGGVACVCASALFSLVLPRVRAEARAVILALQATGGQPVEEVANARADEVPRDVIGGAPATGN
jgi:MFS family permease